MKKHFVLLSIAYVFSMQYAPIQGMESEAAGLNPNEEFVGGPVTLGDQEDSSDSELRVQAQAGDVSACHALGKKCMKSNAVMARIWHEQAAAKGHAGSLCVLGWMYETGTGARKNYSEAHRFYAMAATKGNTFAMNRLGYMYEYGQGVFWDLPRHAMAQYWYEKAAELGDITQMASLKKLHQSEDKRCCIIS